MSATARPGPFRPDGDVPPPVNAQALLDALTSAGSRDQPAPDRAGEPPLQISARHEESAAVVLRVRGSIETASTTEFKRTVHDEIRSGARVLVLDLSGVTFLCLDGVQALATLRQTARLNRTRLVWTTGGNPPVRRALRAAALAAAETLATYRTPHIPAQQRAVS